MIFERVAKVPSSRKSEIVRSTGDRRKLKENVSPQSGSADPAETFFFRRLFRFGRFSQSLPGRVFLLLYRLNTFRTNFFLGACKYPNKTIKSDDFFLLCFLTGRRRGTGYGAPRGSRTEGGPVRDDDPASTASTDPRVRNVCADVIKNNNDDARYDVTI